MKSYIFTITESKKRNAGGYNESASIYRIKNNAPIFVGEVSRNTASTPWKESEVLQKLIFIGELPKKELLRSKSERRGAGYYIENNKCSIKEI